MILHTRLVGILPWGETILINEFSKLQAKNLDQI